ncbi:VIN3-like protein 2 isoform X1 [Brachypodium distachyon]|uniref:Uncharacterized protein n=1 Tax=Brachypodium distachyon TaxID=15368 RepID=I1I1Y2_BRADI|nr:VIN3-like protein 2 isoform X1 [Brachypodium distachyon]KQJ95586.1 hypothetical protein BRADI_3g17950v3 [Brachypodium distachyon]|eukprot:XP_003573553.1 VIN3-like protein 2 isoform X1 [Brachypodium distachyon]
MDLQKRNEMSLNEKRELVYEVSRFPQGAAEILQCWTRRDLLELICAELGKERKYTNVPKSKMIAYLLKLVSRRKVELKNDKSVALLLGQNNHNEMQKKANGEQPHHVTKSVNSDLSLCREVRAGSSLICRNIACQATLNEGDAYCKRCSCCICHKYDENKDPSLWLVCSSDNPYISVSCGLSCHLRCALKNKKAGILKNVCNKLDGSFYCISCGKINWLMRNLRKQLEIARQARRVDVLCERLSLSHKMLKGSEHYKELSNIISSAVKILAKEVGSALDQVSAIIGRTLANRLTCAADVQKLCLSALEIVASTVASTSVLEANNNLEPLGYQPQILFEEITPFSLVIVLKYQDNIYKEDIDGCRVWHRNAKVLNYPVEPTCHILRPNTRNLVSGLSPSTEYFFKVLPFGSTLRFGECEAKCSTRSLDRGSSQCSTQNSESLCIKEDVLRYQKNELNLQKQERVIQYDSPKASTNSSENNESPDRYYKRTKIARLDGTSDNDESQLPPTSEVLPLAGSNSSPSEAPNKPDWLSSTPDSACKNYVEQQYEYCVKVIKWLEHGGHMDKEFRVKFLTWFSLKSSAKDRRVVSAFVHALISDPANLVAQLMDAFMDVVCSKEKPAQSKFPCYKLWH